MSIRYAQWGRNAIHLANLDEKRTLCGQAVPDGTRTVIYSPVVCKRCAAKATEEQVAEAEGHRRELFGQLQAHHDEMLAANQRGEFVIYLCKKCGRQHRGPRQGPGVPYCERPDWHAAELVEITVQGPPFETAEVAA
jgi:hypothetical protein